MMLTHRLNNMAFALPIHELHSIEFFNELCKLMENVPNAEFSKNAFTITRVIFPIPDSRLPLLSETLYQVLLLHFSPIPKALAL